MQFTNMYIIQGTKAENGRLISLRIPPSFPISLSPSSFTSQASSSRANTIRRGGGRDLQPQRSFVASIKPLLRSQENNNNDDDAEDKIREDIDNNRSSSSNRPPSPTSTAITLLSRASTSSLVLHEKDTRVCMYQRSLYLIMSRVYTPTYAGICCCEGPRGRGRQTTTGKTNTHRFSWLWREREVLAHQGTR